MLHEKEWLTFACGLAYDNDGQLSLGFSHFLRAYLRLNEHNERTYVSSLIGTHGCPNSASHTIHSKWLYLYRIRSLRCVKFVQDRLSSPAKK